MLFLEICPLRWDGLAINIDIKFWWRADNIAINIYIKIWGGVFNAVGSLAVCSFSFSFISFFFLVNMGGRSHSNHSTTYSNQNNACPNVKLWARVQAESLVDDGLLKYFKTLLKSPGSFWHLCYCPLLPCAESCWQFCHLYLTTKVLISKH